MVGGLGKGVLALATTAFAAAASSSPPSAGTHRPASPFGGTTPIRIAHVGRIEVDLGPLGSSGLRRVTCAGAPFSTSCFVRR